MTGSNDDDIGQPVRQVIIQALTALRALYDYNLNDYERKLIYQKLELIPWLPAKIRYALNEEIDALSSDDIQLEWTPGLAPRRVDRPRHTTAAKNDEERRIRALTAYCSIEHRKELLRLQGDRAFSRHAWEAVAESYESYTSVDALRKLIRRYGPKGERRQKLKENALLTARKKAAKSDPG